MSITILGVTYTNEELTRTNLNIILQQYERKTIEDLEEGIFEYEEITRRLNSIKDGFEEQLGSIELAEAILEHPEFALPVFAMLIMNHNIAE